MTALNPTQPEPQPDPRPTPQPEPQPASAPQSPQPQEPPTGLRPDPESVPVGRPVPVVLEPLDPTSFTYSVVVPVYNSEAIVGDDGRPDRGGVRAAGAFVRSDPGQRRQPRPQLGGDLRTGRAATRTSSPSTCCATTASTTPTWPASARRTGDYVITMDDDLQNPPDQMRAAHRRGDAGPRRRVRPVRAASRRRRTAGSAAS